MVIYGEYSVWIHGKDFAWYMLGGSLIVTSLRVRDLMKRWLFRVTLCSSDDRIISHNRLLFRTFAIVSRLHCFHIVCI